MEKNNSWDIRKEKGSLLGIKLLYYSYAFFGKFIFNILLYPTVYYYYLTAHEERRASQRYLKKIIATGFKGKFSAFQHFISFSKAFLDKISSCVKPENIKVQLLDTHLLSDINKSAKGAIFLGAHIGNLDACRSHTKEVFAGGINTLMHTKNAPKFMSLMQQFSSDFKPQFLSVYDFSPATAIAISDKLEKGEHIFILADRFSSQVAERTLPFSFLGEDALFGVGPFLLAVNMKAPVYFISAIKVDGVYNVELQKANISYPSNRKENKENIKILMEQYVHWLETLCIKAPLQWYNFYSYWLKKSHLIDDEK